MKAKLGFTMVELIFVIVIIGILAGVAIPKLTMTRDDAKMVTCMDQSKMFMSEMQSYYTSHGQLDDVSKMTNLPIVGSTDTTSAGILSDSDMNTNHVAGLGALFMCEGGMMAEFKHESNATSMKITIVNVTLPSNVLSRFANRTSTISANSLEKANFFRTYYLAGESVSF